MLNSAQTLFGVFFAIFYGLMLNYAGLYHPFDTYDAWRGKKTAQRRLLTSTVVLNVLPFLNFAWILISLGGVEISPQWDLVNVSLILLVLLLSLTVHGYYRIFVALLYKYPRSFYTNHKRIEKLTKLDEEGRTVSFGARFWPGLLYIMIPNLLLALAALNSTYVSSRLDQTQMVGGPANATYMSWLGGGADIAIAVFTAAAVIIAYFQVKHEFGGPDLKLHFPSDQVPLVGPTALTSSLLQTPSMAIFFDASVVFVNDGPQAGVVSELKWRLLRPESRVKRPTGEEDANMLQFRFEVERMVNQPLGATTIEGNSAKAIRAYCAILQSKLTPGTSTPPASNLITGPIGLELTYVQIDKKGQSKRTVTHEYQMLRTIYNQAVVDDYKSKLYL